MLSDFACQIRQTSSEIWSHSLAFGAWNPQNTTFALTQGLNFTLNTYIRLSGYHS